MSRARQERRARQAQIERLQRKRAQLQVDIAKIDTDLVENASKANAARARIIRLFAEAVIEFGYTSTRENVWRVDRELKASVGAKLIDAPGGFLSHWAEMRSVALDEARDAFADEVLRHVAMRQGRGGYGKNILRMPRIDMAQLQARVSTLLATNSFEGVDVEGALAFLLDGLGSQAALLTDVAAANDTTETEQAIAVRTIDSIVTPALIAKLATEKWRGRTVAAAVRDELARETTNRAHLKIALLHAHALADKYAAAGLVEAEARDVHLARGGASAKDDPILVEVAREAGKAHAFELQDMAHVRDILAEVGWRGAETVDDVDMRFRRLVEERTIAMATGELSFVNEVLLKGLPKDKADLAEKNFQERVYAEYDIAKAGLGRIVGVLDGRTPDPADEALKFVEETLAKAIVATREKYKSGGWPADLDAEARASSIGIFVGDATETDPDAWAKFSQLLTKMGWKGATEETATYVFAKEMLTRAKKLDDVANGMADDIEAKHPVLAEQLRQSTTKLMDGTPGLSLAPRSRDEVIDPFTSIKGPADFDARTMAVGVKVWGETYRRGMSDVAARDYLSTQWMLKNLHGSTAGREESLGLLHFAAKWAVHAFQRVQASHTFAAAMAGTHTPPELLGDLQLPWSAFLVQVPPGLLWATLPNGERGDISRIACASYDDHAEMHLVGFAGSSGGQNETWTLIRGNNFAEVIDESREVPKDSYGRAVLLAKRLVASLLFALQTPANRKEKTVKAYRGFRNGRRIEEPEHRIVIVGHPTVVDCREALNSYISTGRYERERRDGDGTSTKRGPPSVQTYVRAHWTHQAHGPRHSLRKVLWIEGYWRGPEDAPIMMRPHRLVRMPKGETP